MEINDQFCFALSTAVFIFVIVSYRRNSLRGCAILKLALKEGQGERKLRTDL